MISFHGVGLSAAPSINYHQIASALEDPEEVTSLNMLVIFQLC